MTDKKKAPKEEKDESTMKLLGVYRRKCDLNGVSQIKSFKEKIESIVEEQGKFQTLQMWEEIGPVCVRAIMDSFSEISYKHLKKLRLWKIRAEDEGLRAVCNYVDKVQTIEYLDLLDNNITPLGCEFLGKTLIMSNCPIFKLKLDHNSFGTEGLQNLTAGLNKNSTLQKLSLKYCNINEEGAKYIQEILANINSKLKSLKLNGNPLKNEGAFQILRAVEFNETLQKLNISDIQINLLAEQEQSQENRLADKMTDVLEKNANIFSYDFRFNQLSDEVAHKIVMKVQSNTSIVKLEMSETVAQQIRQLLAQTLKKRKAHKKGKKKTAPKKKKK